MRHEAGELRWLWRQMWAFRGLYAAQLSLVLLSSIIGLVDPLIIKWLIDEVLPWRNVDMLWLAAGAFLGANALNFLLMSLNSLIDNYASQRLMFNVRLKLLRHLQRLSPEYYLRTPTGDLLHRMEQDVQQIRELGGNTMASLLRITVMTSLTLVILFLLNWKLTLMVLPLLPVMLWLRSFGIPRLRKAVDRTLAADASRVSFLQDHLTAMPQVQLLNRGAGERKRFVGIARTALAAMLQRQAAELALSYTVNLTMVSATALVLGYGGFQVFRGDLTVGGLVAFYTYLSRVFGPTQTLASLYSSVQRASASIRRVMNILETPPLIVEPRTPVRLQCHEPLAVALQGVRFGYQPERPVLDGLKLVLDPGEKVALVGATGCGKSTIARLLTRMYDPDEGSVMLDEIDVRDLRLKDLRQCVALVPQDPVLFDVSLRENLLYARPGASDHELHRVLRMTQLVDTVKKLPQGWNELIGPRGGRLSGGQRQRLAVARAILQDPRLLILDEATSALDAATEHRLLTELNSFVKDRVTTVLIAHRLSAILWADRVVVLKAGKVIADGTHHELYLTSRIYQEICDKQLQSDLSAIDPMKAAASAVER